MQKYEKLEKIGEGNGTTRCSCKIFLYRPFSIPCSPGSSTVSNTHRLRPQHWLQPRPELNTPCRPLSFPLASPADAPSQPQHRLETYLPTLTLPASSAPSLGTLCRLSPSPQPQCSMQTSNLNVSADPHFSPRPAHHPQTRRKHRLYWRPLYPRSCSLCPLQTRLSHPAPGTFSAPSSFTQLFKC